MKISSRALIELLGAASIVASLVFVGVQLAQDRTVALGAVFDNRTTAGMEMQRTRFESDAYIKQVADRWDQGALPGWWNEDIQSYKDQYQVSTEGIYRLSILGIIGAMYLDNNYYQYQLGLIGEEDWLEIRKAQAATLKGSAVYRAMYSNLTGLRPDTKNLVKELLAEQDIEG